MRPTLLFDADCGFCTRVAGVVPRLRLGVEVVSLQSADLASLGIDPARAMIQMPYVGADHTVSYGHRAIAAALRTGPAPLRLLGRLLTAPGIGKAARATYGWVARHRHQLPGGTAACTLPMQPKGQQPL